MKAFCILSLVAAPLLGQQAIVLDFSGSMKGIAEANKERLTGVVQRLASTLAAGGGVQAYQMHTPIGGQRTFKEVQVGEAALRFGQAGSFQGNSPLTHALDQIRGSGRIQEVVFFTDGMEDGGQVEKVAAALSEMADAGWSIGLAAARVPFSGRHYAEQKIPIHDFLPQIEEAVKNRNPNWRVAEINCKDETSSCYQFTGEKPLLMLLLSKTGSLERLFKALRQSTEQMQLMLVGTVRMAPAGRAEAVLGLEHGSPQAKLAVKLPADLNARGAALDCAIADDQTVPMQVTLRTRKGDATEEPSVMSAIGFKALGMPSWIRTPVGPLKLGSDGATRQTLSLVCEKPGLLEGIVDKRERKGRLIVVYTTRPVLKSTGWWREMSTENTWQYPFQVYKLSEVLAQVHQRALLRIRDAEVRLDVGLRSQN